MENHLGILDLPQPMNAEIQVQFTERLRIKKKFHNIICIFILFIQLSTLGSVTKYVRSYSGNANDFIYRKQVKALMDTLVVRKLIYILE